jgi:general secretion pathway protein H
MVVIAIIAIGASVVGLALRDGSADRLDQDGVRLAALLEAARAEARASNLPVRWEVAGPGSEGDAQFRFIGLPPSSSLPLRFMHEGVRAEVVGARAVPLGPEPMIGPQRIVLGLGDRRLALATDGLGPFAVVESQ